MNGMSDRKRLLGLARAGIVCWCALCVVLASSAAGKTIEEVEKELVAKHGKLKSYTAKTLTKQDMAMGEGNRYKAESTGTMEWAQRADKVLYRMEMESTSVTTISKKETKSKTTATMVCDGEFITSLNDMDGRKMAFKSKVDPSQSGDVKATFKGWKKEYDLKLLPDEKIEKQACYVIEATPKKKKDEKGAAQVNQFSRMRYWYRKDLGIVVKYVAYDKDNKPTMTSTTTDIKVNPDIKPERFKLKVPEGVQMTDMTKQQQPRPPKDDADKGDNKDEDGDADEDDDVDEDEEDDDDDDEKEEKEEKEESKAEKGVKGLLRGLK